jgi:hypothetical protein
MDRFDHRHARPLHRFRHGWRHLRQHATGVRHGHERRPRHRDLGPGATPKEAIRRGRHLLHGPAGLEYLRQFALGALLAVVIAFVVCAIWGTVTILQARDDLRGAQGEATALAVDRTQLFTSLGRTHALVQIDKMQVGAENAAALVNGSAQLKVLSWIPFVGQQVDGVTDLVNDFDTTSNQANALLSAVNRVVSYSHGTTISLPALSILQLRVSQSLAALRPLDRGSGLLIGPIASARDSFDKEIVKITALLSTGKHLLSYAGPFLGADGPRTYLVAGENNAEMRDQGAVLSWAVLTANNGTFKMGKASSVGKLRLAHPAPVPLPPGTESAFGLMDPTQVWQSVNASADFPLSGQVMAAMYEQRTHKAVDGVIAVDARALEGVLRAIPSPLTVPGIPGKVTSKNVVFVLLHGLYLLYPKNYEQNTRHDEVAAVASAAVHWMHSQGHHYDLAFLVDQLAKAAPGRHLLVWSKFPVLEHAIEAFGASGSLTVHGTNAIHLGIESAVAAKLDWYIRTDVVYQVFIDANGAATIEAKVVVANTAPAKGYCDLHPEKCPHYILGPDHINSFIKGQYVGRLDLWFPRDSIVPGGLDESGLKLARAEIKVLPQHQDTLLLVAFIPHAIKHGRFSLSFIPQSSVWPQFVKVNFSAPTWSVSGPSSTLWHATTTKLLTWSLS